MSKRLAAAVASFAAVGAAALAMAPSALATANGGSCSLQGTASFGTPLTAGPAASPFTYTFSGNLSNCQSGNASSGAGGGPTSGTIFTPDPVSGSGSCVNSTTGPGVAVVNWSDGLATVESYTTSGALAAVAQQGKVIASYTSTTQKDASGNPITYTTTEPATPVGDSGAGTLAFQPPSPTSCTTGVSTAAITGQIFTGNSS